MYLSPVPLIKQGWPISPNSRPVSFRTSGRFQRNTHGEAKIDFDGQIIKLTGKLPDFKIVPQALAEAKWLRNLIIELTNRKLFNVTAIVYSLDGIFHKNKCSIRTYG